MGLWNRVCRNARCKQRDRLEKAASELPLYLYTALQSGDDWRPGWPTGCEMCSRVNNARYAQLPTSFGPSVLPSLSLHPWMILMGEEVAGLVDRQVQFPGSNYCFIFIFSILVIISLLSGFDIDIEKRDCALELKLNWRKELELMILYHQLSNVSIDWLEFKQHCDETVCDARGFSMKIESNHSIKIPFEHLSIHLSILILP